MTFNLENVPTEVVEALLEQANQMMRPEVCNLDQEEVARAQGQFAAELATRRNAEKKS